MSPRFRRGVTAFAIAGILAVTAAVPTFAAATPLHGPTAGGTTVLIPVPATTKAWTAISAGNSASAALDTQGKVYSWGYGQQGQLGNGATADSAIPVPVDTSGVLAGKVITQISFGDYHALALDEDGRVYTWGEGANGQLGTGTLVSSSVPVAVDTSGVLAGKVITQIAAGQLHSVALDKDGRVYTWGTNNNGQLGNNSADQSSVPVAVDTSGVLAGKTITQIAAGNFHSMAVSSDGQAYTWGGNASLGNGTFTYSPVPVAVDTTGVLAGKTITKVAGGQLHSVALGQDGQTYSWGMGGLLGDGSVSGISPTPVAVDHSGVLAGKRITGIASGNQFSLVIDDEGHAYTWGSGGQGALGNGAVSNALTPVAVDRSGALAGKKIVTFDAGSSHAVAIDEDGRAYAWGAGNRGGLGNGATANSLVPVAVSPVPTAESVLFGGLPAASVTRVDSATLSVVTPAHASGTVDIRVLADAVEVHKITAGFTFGSAPTIAAHPTSIDRKPQSETTLAATASGDEAPTARWESRASATAPWSPVAQGIVNVVTGASTRSELTVKAPQAGTGVSYRAVFTNGLGTVTTQVAAVTGQRATSPTPTTPPSAPSPNISVSHLTRLPGERQTLRGTGFTPGEKVTVVMKSDPVRIGTVAVDSEGKFMIEFLVPKGTPDGVHTLTATGSVSKAVSTSFTVGLLKGDGSKPKPPGNGDLAETGAGVLGLGAGALLLILLGAAASVRARQVLRKRTLN